jgi:hypothetical protein
MFGNRVRIIPFAGAPRSRKCKRSFRPNVDPLEQRIALHGGALRTAIQVAHPAIDVQTAATQVMTTIAASLKQFGTLQIQLDALAAKMQKESRAAQKATAKTAQTMINQFVAGEVARYQQVVSLAKTVPSSQAFTAILQLEQGVHKDLVGVKSTLGPTFKLMVGATYSTTKTSSRILAPTTLSSSRAVSQAESAKAHADDGTDTVDADGVMLILIDGMNSIRNDLFDVNHGTDSSAKFAISKSLGAYKFFLNICLVFYNLLEPLLSANSESLFNDVFNGFVKEYNSVVAATNGVVCTNH